MSAEDSASKQQQKDETSLSSSNDLPEIKFPFILKWFHFEGYVLEKPRYMRMHNDNVEEQCTRSYHIPGFPGFKYDATIHIRSGSEIDRAESDFAKKYLHCLRVRLVPTNPKYKDYKVYAEWTDRGESRDDVKMSCELNDNVQYLDQKVFFFFPEAYKMPGFFVAQGTFTIQQIYSKDLEIENVPEEHRQLFEAEDGKDFTLVAGKKEIKVHKSVLIHNSPVFAVAVNGNEWKEGAERKYAIPDFSHKIVQIAVNLIYGNVYDESLTKDEYVSLFQFADKYQMDELKKAVKECVILTPHNVCEYLNLCHAKNCAELLDYCLEYMLIFSQNGYPINDKGSLNPEVKILFADRTIKEPLKHRVAPKDNYYTVMDERDKHYTSETSCVEKGRKKCHVAESKKLRIKKVQRKIILVFFVDRNFYIYIFGGSLMEKE
uniref:BTB domain-containing protein n=1 Tax=Panagrolaimus sp. ES5 TaxID=591445 RepID=A0AC34FCB1_9BILA